jgi:hypothetical protein
VRRVGMAAGAEGQTAALLDPAGRIEDQVLPVAAGGIVAGGALHHGEVRGGLGGASREQALDQGRARRDPSQGAEGRVGGGAVVGEDLPVELPREMLRRGARGCGMEAAKLRAELPGWRRWLRGGGVRGRRRWPERCAARSVVGGRAERRERRCGGARGQRRREEREPEA